MKITLRDRLLVMEADERRRRLERLAVQGDPQARAAARREHRRAMGRSRPGRVVDRARAIFLRDHDRENSVPGHGDDWSHAAQRTEGSARRYVRLAHAHGIDPKHGLKEGAKDFDHHMNRISTISFMEGAHHSENAERGLYPSDDDIFFHPKTKKPVAFETGAPGGATQWSVDSHRSRYDARMPRRPRFLVHGDPRVTASHATEIADVLKKDYGIESKQKHGRDPDWRRVTTLSFPHPDKLWHP